MRAFSDAKELRSFLPQDDLFKDMRAVLGEGDQNPDLVIIKRNPSWYDANGNRPLLGNDGLPIRKALLDFGVKFYATNAFPFVAADGKVTAKQAKLAAPVIAEELRRVGGKKYLLLGADAARWTPVFQYPFKKHVELLGRNLQVGDDLFRVVHAPMAIANTPALFKAMLTGIEELLDPGKVQKVAPPARESYRVVTNAHQARNILSKAPELVACDTETTGLDPYTCRILTVQLSWEEGTGYSFPWELFTPEEWGGILGSRKLIFQNGQYDMKVLASNGVYVRLHEDTLLMHSLVDETPGTHSMEQMSHKYLGIDKWSDIINYDSMEDNDLRTLGRYGARDTDITLRLANHFRPLLEGRYIGGLIHRAQNSIVRTELRGVRVDRDKADQFLRELEGHLHDSKERLADSYDLQNPNSPTQVLGLLQKMRVPLNKVKGSWTTKEEAIAPHADNYPVIRDILEFRHMSKVAGTYLKNILEKSARDGRYHGEFKLAGTETGRLTESLLLLIPRADDLQDPDLGDQYRVRLRELFIPDEGHTMIGADFSGLEVAVSAYLTGDEQLIHDIQNQLDTHSAVAIEAFGLGIPLEPYATLKKRVSAEYGYHRTLAKSATFSWLYGGEEDAVMSGTGITDRDVAKQVLLTLRSRYHGVAAWQDRVRAQARETHSTTTPWGRTRRFLWHNGLSPKVIAEQEREGINFPNQAMATDMNLAAFTALEEAGVQTLFPMHDAVYAQARDEEVDKVSRLIQTTMEGVIPGVVPFRAEVSTGPNWAAL